MANASTAAGSTEARSGRYVALTNLSIGRGDKDRQADIVHAGDTVTLTDEEAQRFLSGHRVPVIRKASDRDAGRRITARDLFGKAPGAPASDQIEDLRNSTQVIRSDDDGGSKDEARTPARGSGSQAS